MLFGVEGWRRIDAQAGPGGTLEEWAVMDYLVGAGVPGPPGHPRPLHGWRRPGRGMFAAGDLVAVRGSSRWKRDEPGRDLKISTEWLLQVPPRAG